MQKKDKPLILISNDDGVHAAGIRALAEVASGFGEVVVVAPERGNSGKSHAVTLTEPLRLLEVPPIAGAKAYAVTGTPVDAMKMAIGNILEKKPGLVLSGINHGSNAAINVIYSGTMAAAVEGAMFSIPSIGFSLTNHSPDADFSAAKVYVRKIIENVLENGMAPYTCLNVNIPDVPAEEIRGLRVCRQARGVWRDGFIKRTHPAGFDYYWMSGNFHNFDPEDEMTDEWALRNNYVSVVPVHVDMTNHHAMETLKSLEE